MGGFSQRISINITRDKVRQAVQTSIKQVPRTTTFVSTFSPKHNPNLHRLPWVIEDASHLLNQSVRDSIAHKSQTGLWWSIIAPISVCQKKTVRSWVQRRIRESFKEALKSRGYDDQGVPISTTREGLLKHNLHGSLRIMGLAAVVAAPKASVDADMSKLVEYLISYGTQRTLRSQSFNSTDNGTSGLKIRRIPIAIGNIENARMAAAG